MKTSGGWLAATHLPLRSKTIRSRRCPVNRRWRYLTIRGSNELMVVSVVMRFCFRRRPALEAVQPTRPTKTVPPPYNGHRRFAAFADITYIDATLPKH